jgi:MFS family permease
VSSVAFVAARGVAWLYAGEIIYGIGSAAVMSCVSIAIRELHPTQHVERAALAASVAMAAGLTLGPLASGLLASFTPWPTVSPYVLDIVLATILAAALLGIPETRIPTAAARERVAVFHVPAELRRAFVGPASAGAASFMLVGWVFALSPSFLHEVLNVRITRPVIGGLFAALVVGTSGGAQVVLRHHHGRRPTTIGLGGVVLGMGVIAASSASMSLAVMIFGGVVAGAGAGVVQMNAMTAVQHLAPVHGRGSVMSTYITLCYLALSIPMIIAGVAADHFGLEVVTAWYAIALALVVAVALLLSGRPDRSTRHRTPQPRGGTPWS